MQRQPVDSSIIKEVGYDTMEQTLEVEFNNGDIWDYLDVPAVAYEEMMESSSIGSYFLRNIKNEFEAVHIN